MTHFAEPDKIRTCRICGKQFKRIVGVTGNSLCSDECRKKANALRFERKEKVCIVCGKNFKVDIKNGTHRDCCSDECFYKYKLKCWAEKYIQQRDTAEYGEGKCAECGKTFQKRYGLTHFCSEECKAAYHSESMVCKNCGKHFAKRKNNNNIFCCIECFKEYQHKHKSEKKKQAQHRTFKCERCGTVFECKHKRKYCDACRPAVEKEQRRALHLKNFISKKVACKYCGKIFETRPYKSKTFCCKECAAAYQKHQHNHNKDHRLDGKIIDNDITLLKLMRRDKRVCKLCGQPVDKNDFTIIDGVFYAGEKYPSIDHIVPIAQGGMHSWNNVQLAHFKCNTLKRDSFLFMGCKDD